jgi:nitrogen fixation protein NifB
MHLPVAVRGNARRRWGFQPSGQALAPEEAIGRLKAVVAAGTDIRVVGITGPGDPLAEPAPTLRTLHLVREAFPGMALCLSTNGLNSPAIANGVARELAGLGLVHVTLLIDAVDPEIVAALYAWIRPAKHTLPLPEAARELVAAQAASIQAFVAAGLRVKVNAYIYPGVNDQHLPELARWAREQGASVMAFVPFAPQAGAEHDDQPQAPDPDLVHELRRQVMAHIELMPHFEACGQDIAGLETPAAPSVKQMPRPTTGRPNVALASSNGMEVDLHLGQAARFLIYGPRTQDGLVGLIGDRSAPDPGGGDERWRSVAETLCDCFALLVSSAGQRPRMLLAESGLRVLPNEGGVEGLVDALYGGGKKGKCKKS